MSQQNIVRAWKDEEYRSSLSEDERALLPAHPAGLIELDDADLDAAAGGVYTATWPCRVTLGGCSTDLPRLLC
jgi:mersacidin/lichenicidin family type 2 lantibiotic